LGDLGKKGGREARPKESNGESVWRPSHQKSGAAPGKGLLFLGGLREGSSKVAEKKKKQVTVKGQRSFYKGGGASVDINSTHKRKREKEFLGC